MEYPLRIPEGSKKLRPSNHLQYLIVPKFDRPIFKSITKKIDNNRLSKRSPREKKILINYRRKGQIKIQ